MALVDYKRATISLKIVFFGPDKDSVRHTMTEVYRDYFGEEPDFEKLKTIRQGMLGSFAAIFGKKGSKKSDIDFFGFDLGRVSEYQISGLVQGFGANISSDQVASGLNGADCLVFVPDEADEQKNIAALRTLNGINEHVPMILPTGNIGSSLENAFRESKDDLEFLDSTDALKSLKSAVKLACNRLQ